MSNEVNPAYSADFQSDFVATYKANESAIKPLRLRIERHLEEVGFHTRLFKTGVPQGGVLPPTVFNIYTANLPPPRTPVQVISYAHDITIIYTHTQAQVQPKIHTTIFT